MSQGDEFEIQGEVAAYVVLKSTLNAAPEPASQAKPVDSF